MAEAVGVMAEPQRWEELTANAHGVVAVLDPGCLQGAEAYYTFAAPQAKAIIQDNPTLLLERLDEKQKVVDKKERSLDHMNESLWPTERGANYCEHFNFSMADFTPGLWRMTVKGTAGEDKAPWASEPRLLHLAPPPKPDQPNQNLSATRITFDP